MGALYGHHGPPLYGRNTGHLKLMPFSARLLKEIFACHSPRHSKADLLALWTITGGVARYVQLLMDNHAYTQRKMASCILGGVSSFLDEGRTLLAEEFGPDYGLYFSVLSEIASGRTTFGELSNAVGADIGTCLARLENEYGLVRRLVPAFDKAKSRNSAYSIEDCFLRFWFRFVFKYRGWIELGRHKAVEDVVSRDFEVFSGWSLERYFRWRFVGEGTYTRIEGWWDRKGENEIDLVCEDEPTGTLDFYEVKRDARRLDMGVLKEKVEAFFNKNPALRDRKVSCRGLSLRDM